MSAGGGAVLVRAMVLLAGGGALIWSLYCLPIFQGQAGIEAVKRRIINREAFRPESLVQFSSQEASRFASKWQRPSVMASSAAVDLRIAENSFGLLDTSRIDVALERAETGIEGALAQAPADALLWAAYFWVENNRRGFTRENLRYLQFSYDTGTYEAWVAFNRSRFSFALFKLLPPELADRAVSEFRGIVASGFYSAAVDIMSRQDEELRTRLLGSLSGLDWQTRSTFAKAAYYKGYNWRVPGVDSPEWRPWH